MALIASRALFWWRFLPPSTKAWYDAEDLIADCVLHVHRRSPRYDPSKARESTWIYRVVDNYCKAQLSRSRRLKYAACATVEMTDLVARSLASPRDPLGESKDAVERVIALAGDRVRDFLEKVFDGGVITEVPVHELREVARSASASCDDFLRVYRAAVG